MKIINTGSAMVPVDELVPHPQNANRGDMASIKASIEINGFFGRIVANGRTGHVLVGNHRLQAAKELGLTEVPVEWVDVSEEDEIRILLADNRTARLGDDDDEALAVLLKELQGTDAGLLGTGYEDAYLAQLLHELQGKPEPQGGGSDFDPTPGSGLTETQEGDLWLIDGGKHRLYVGDCTEPGTILLALEESAPADLLLTDPPYNVANVGGFKEHGPKFQNGEALENDNMTPEAFRQFLAEALTLAADNLKPGGGFYICYADASAYEVFGAAMDADLRLASPPVIVWMKDRFVLGRGDYHAQHESILYGWKPGAPHHAVEDRTQSTVWEFDGPKKSEDHPTMKPVELLERAIENSSSPGELVLDPFAGSGTTLIAAHRTGRRSYLIEIEPKFADVILRRARAEGLSVEKEEPLG